MSEASETIAFEDFLMANKAIVVCCGIYCRLEMNWIPASSIVIQWL